MPKVSPVQNSFGGGEFSPLLNGRFDLDRYKEALETCKNYMPALQGGLIRRSGTYYVAEVKDSTKSTRLVAFQFSTTQAYILEFGDEYVRFYRNNGQIFSGMSAYEVATPYQDTEVFDLRFTQSNDVLYICHPSYAPRTLSRTGHTSWTLSTITFSDGPYLPINTTAYSLTPGAATGTGQTLKSGSTTNITGTANSGGLVRITAVAHGKSTGDQVGIDSVTGTTEANGSWTITVIDADHFDLQGSTYANAWVSGGKVYPAVFVSTDVGRHVRLREGSVWGWAKIASFVHYGSVTIDIQSTLTNTNAKTVWRLGVWSATTGYPSCVTFHEDRLAFAGSTSYPQRVDLSCTADYTNFRPSDTAGTVVASDALSFTFNSNDVNVTRWLVSDEKGLLAGTAGGEWLVRPSSQGEALTPVNITAKRSTKYGSAAVQALQVGKSALFVQKSGRKIRELAYYFDQDGFRASDLTLLAEHITQSGIVEMAAQAEPQPIMWAVREDGVLAGLTYERDMDTFKVGWHRHFIGGSSDTAGSHAVVESVAVIPSSDGSRDELWMIVRRYINGATQRYVEYMKPIFNDEMEQKEAFFVDCGLTYDSPKTITGISIAAQAVVTAVAHGFSNGDKVLLSDILGVVDPDDESDEPTSPLNGQSYLVSDKTADTFKITDLEGNYVATTGYSAWTSGGYARKFVSSITGLDHLEGETVDILADGAVQPSATVSAGGISLSAQATTVHIGFGYNSDGKMLRLNAGSADGTAIGKTQRTHRMGIMMHRSLGLKIGDAFDNLTELNFRSTSDSYSRAVPLFTGILSEEFEGDYSFENQFCFRQSQPLPSLILALLPQMMTQDR